MTTYLVNKRLDMLPKLLTTELSSITDTEDHFVFSVLWEITPEGEIVNVKFHKGLIRSIGALAYR